MTPDPEQRPPAYVRRTLVVLVLLCVAMVAAVVAMEPPADQDPTVQPAGS